MSARHCEYVCAVSVDGLIDQVAFALKSLAVLNPRWQLVTVAVPTRNQTGGLRKPENGESSARCRVLSVVRENLDRLIKMNEAKSAPSMTLDGAKTKISESEEDTTSRKMTYDEVKSKISGKTVLVIIENNVVDITDFVERC